jgi:hypothetical protein
MELLTSGRVTLSEVAHLAVTSQQRVHNWVKYGFEHKGPPGSRGSTRRFDLDVRAARAAWQAKQLVVEIDALGTEDRATEREWDAALKLVRRRLSNKAGS